MYKAKFTEFQAKGITTILISVEDEIKGIIGISDKIKDQAPYALEKLREKGLEVFMLTGDNKHTALSIGKQLKFDEQHILAEVLPNEKAETIKKLQESEESKVVGMVGDGINDAPALAQADVGIAIGSGTDIAMETADIILMRGDLRNVVSAINLSEKTYRKMISNLFWAFIYNLIGIPIAAGVLYYATGFFLPPYLAAVFMASSSVSVVTNALFLKRYEPKTSQQIEEERLLISQKKVVDPVCGPNCEAHFKQDTEKFKNYDNMNPKLMQMKSSEEDLVIDPVCGMKGKPENWIEHEHDGEKYYFCNKSCLVKFKKDPHKYVKSENEKEIKEIDTIKEDNEVDKKMGKLKCAECGETILELPMHCGKPMHKENNQLVCWMGASCGSQSIPEHCGKPMDVIE
jgi:Cu+-exporting ATPase